MCQVELLYKDDISIGPLIGGKYARIKATSSLDNPVEFPPLDNMDPTLLVSWGTYYYFCQKFFIFLPVSGHSEEVFTKGPRKKIQC